MVAEFDDKKETAITSCCIYEACPKSKVSINIKNRKSAWLKKFLHGHIILLINYFPT